MTIDDPFSQELLSVQERSITGEATAVAKLERRISELEAEKARFCASLDDRAKGQEDPEQSTDTWSGEYAIFHASGASAEKHVRTSRLTRCSPVAPTKNR